MNLAFELSGAARLKLSVQPVLFAGILEWIVLAFYRFNNDNIYKNQIILNQIDRIDQMLTDIFYLFLNVSETTKRGKKNTKKYRGEAINVFYEFLDEMKYTDKESNTQIVSDFVTGMTDIYATRVYQEMFLVSAPV